MTTGVIFIVAAFLELIIAYLQKRFGLRSLFLLLSSVIGFAAMIVMFYNPSIYGLICLGFSYSIFTPVIWSTIGIIVDKKHLVKTFSNINFKCLFFILFYF
jgi:hypothetical protein